MASKEQFGGKHRAFEQDFNKIFTYVILCQLKTYDIPL